MIIGVLQAELDIPGAQSLKDKRRVLRSLKDRLHRGFNISVAEVGNQDLWQTAQLGVVIVSNDRVHANQVLSQVVNALQRDRGALLRDYSLRV